MQTIHPDAPSMHVTRPLADDRTVDSRYNAETGYVILQVPLTVFNALLDAWDQGKGALELDADDEKYGPYSHNDLDLLDEALHFDGVATNESSA